MAKGKRVYRIILMNGISRDLSCDNVDLLMAPVLGGIEGTMEKVIVFYVGEKEKLSEEGIVAAFLPQNVCGMIRLS